ncbi:MULTISPECIES: DUF4336 domain-containing protein [unclassified Sinorhizobium]|uniref:DUF4336 domain-containing protein n=1 Tax=unclassified Sinorhizobium TaxID=2613772 RepID=UPI003523D74E
MSHNPITYPPLDVLKPAGDGLWVVDSGPLHALGIIPLPVRMTVMRLESGGIILHSPTRYNGQLRGQIEQHGPISHLVAPNSAHWSFLKEWKDQVPQALAWAAPGLRARRPVRKSGIEWHDDLGLSSSALWSPDIEQIEVPGLGGFCEICFFHRRSDSLILTDLMQNLDNSTMSPPLRIFSTLTGAQGRAPIYLRAIIKLKGAAARTAAERLVALDPKRVVFSHGQWFETDASFRLRKALDWLL